MFCLKLELLLGIYIPSNIFTHYILICRNAPSAVDFGAISVDEANQTATFTIAWSTDFADTGVSMFSIFIAANPDDYALFNNVSVNNKGKPSTNNTYP